MSKDIKLYCVVRWTGGVNCPERDGGFVVRTGYLRDDGTVWLPAPYTGAFLYGRNTSLKRAENLADKLNRADLKEVRA